MYSSTPDDRLSASDIGLAKECDFGSRSEIEIDTPGVPTQFGNRDANSQSRDEAIQLERKGKVEKGEELDWNVPKCTDVVYTALQHLAVNRPEGRIRRDSRRDII